MTNDISFEELMNIMKIKDKNEENEEILIIKIKFMFSN